MSNNSQALGQPAKSGRSFDTRWINKALLYLLLIVLAVPFVFPFWWMVMSSFKSASEIFAFPPKLVPTVWHLSLIHI